MTKVVAIDSISCCSSLSDCSEILDLVFTNQHREKSNEKRVGQDFGIFIVVSFHSDLNIHSINFPCRHEFVRHVVAQFIRREIDVIFLIPWFFDSRSGIFFHNRPNWSACELRLVRMTELEASLVILEIKCTRFGMSISRASSKASMKKTILLLFCSNSDARSLFMFTSLGKLVFERSR